MFLIYGNNLTFRNFGFNNKKKKKKKIKFKYLFLKITIEFLKIFCSENKIEN